MPRNKKRKFDDSFKQTDELDLSDLDQSFDHVIDEEKDDTYLSKKPKLSDLNNAKKLINDLGVMGDTTKDKRNQINIPKKLDVTRETDPILRAVMRYPDQEVLNQLYTLHGKLADLLKGESDNALKWLLIASVDHGRGAMRDPTVINKFLNGQPDEMKPQLLITRLENLLTAIGYRAVRAGFIKDTYPDEKNNPDAFKLAEKLSKLVNLNEQDSTLVQFIGSVYTARSSDDVAETDNSTQQKNLPPKSLKSDEFFEVQTKHVSDTSGLDTDIDNDTNIDDNQADNFRKPLHERFFRAYIGDKSSWVSAAHKGGIPVRAHVSGTGPLVMATIRAFYLHSGDKNEWILDDENAKKLCGPLLIATFERGDYHTMAETAAAVLHYLSTIKKDESKPLSPIELFEAALKMLESGASDEVIKEYGISLKTAINTMFPEVMKNVSHIEFSATEESESTMQYKPTK